MTFTNCMVRQASVSDVPGMVSLANEFASAAHWRETEYQRVLSSGTPRRLILVAELENRTMVGFLVAKQIEQEWELENIVVGRALHRRGIAMSLMNRLIETAKSGNGSSIFLEVRDSNTPARALYERMGWKQTGKRLGYYLHPPEDAITYVFHLQ